MLGTVCSQRDFIDPCNESDALCGIKVPVSWNAVAKGSRIPKFSDGVTREYEGYDGQIIKQADANLLAYPLKAITRPEEIKRDLLYYEQIGRAHV